MARTLNPEVHTVRRDAFIEAAQRLMSTRGWDQMSIQDVLDELGASRGAFYHYFDSKQALLEAVIERMVGAGLTAVQPVVDDPSLTAATKLERVFSGIGRWKTERKALVLRLLDVWLSDDNAIVREKFRRSMVGRLVTMLATIIVQGVGEGSYKTASPAETARILVLLLLGFQDVATDMFIARQKKTISLDEVEQTFMRYSEAFERILGAPAGSIHMLDQSVLQAWFG